MLTKNDITSAVVENWLADFEQALAAPSDAGLRALFPPDCHWRDVLALTWTIQTLGRPSYAPLVRYRSFEYQAASWDRPRRVIAEIEHHLGELFPRGTGPSPVSSNDSSRRADASSGMLG